MLLSQTTLLFAQPQNEQKVAATIKTLQKIFENEEARLSQEKPISRDSSVITFLSRLSIQQKDSSYSYDNYYEAYEKLLRKQTGLSVNIDALQNFNQSQSDVEEGILYQRRAQAGIEWNILNGGYFDSRAQLKTIPAERNYFNNLASNESKDDFGIKMNECIYWFNEHKKSLLVERERILNRQIKYLEDLYFAKKIDKEQLLRSQTRIAEINGMKGIFNSYNQHIDSKFDSTLLAAEVPLFDLNYDYFFGILNSQELADSMRLFLEENLARQNSWYNEIKLRTYARYNVYDLLTSDPAYRRFFSVGVSVGIPIPFTNKEQSAVNKYKTQKQLYTLDTDLKNQRIELLNLAYEFRYQLKQYIIFHQKRILANEAIRRERVKAKMLDADFNPLHGLELIDNLLQIDIELLDLKQNLYIKLLRIHSKQNNLPLDSMIVQLDLPNYFDFEDETERGVYVWSKIFETQNPSFIQEYIVYNQFDEAYIAVSENDKQIAAKTALVKSLNKSEIDVYPMVGQNKLLDSDDFKGDLEDLLKPFNGWKIAGIHLDIEPHVRADWKSNKAELMSRYSQIIDQAKIICDSKGWKLSIDIPINMDTAHVNSMFAKVDMIRFMCYENVKQEYLVRKLSAFKEHNNKIMIDLRTEDFATRDEMELFAKALYKETGIKCFGFHDLYRLIEMDKKTMTENEKH
jgi:hypothetical protein